MPVRKEQIMAVENELIIINEKGERIEMPPDAPSLENLRAAWADGEARQAFWEAHHAELLAKYPEQFVAVSKQGEVVAVAPDLLEVVQMIEDQGLNTRQTWIEFLTAHPEHLMTTADSKCCKVRLPWLRPHPKTAGSPRCSAGTSSATSNSR
jgi:hypothetical protein